MGYVKNNKYYSGTPDSNARIALGFRERFWEDQRIRHRKDIIQPFKDDLPNPEFIRAYPEQSTRYFSQDEIRKYGNK